MSERGAIWRKWDLHIHTPASFQWQGAQFAAMTPPQADGACRDIITRMNESDIDVFAIMDYWTFDGYLTLQRFRQTNPTVQLRKTLLPGMELRCEAPMRERLTIHVILSDDLSEPQLADFKSALRLLLVDRPLSDDALAAVAPKLSHDKLRRLGHVPNQLNDVATCLQIGQKTALVSRESFFEAVQAMPKDSCLILLPFDTNGGFENVDWKKHGVLDTEFMTKAHLFEVRDSELHNLFLGRKTPQNEPHFDNFLKTLGNRPKPPVSGSDAHSVTKYGSYPRDQHGKERCTWIKAAPTFRGLCHLLHEPASRCFIGPLPPKVSLVREHSTKYIRSLTIRKKAGASLDEKWFDVELHFNHDLVAIVGNKGSGKSALVDILGLLGCSKNEPEFSFLNDDKFRSPRMNKAQHFEATLTWESGDCVSRGLGDSTPNEEVERVKYLPQNYLEKICNEIREGDGGGFDAELKAVILSHVPAADRLDTETLGELLDLKTKQAYETVGILKEQLRGINAQIVKLEKHATKEHRIALTKQLQVKDDELRAHDATRPADVAPPGQDPAADALVAEIQAVRADQQIAEADIDEATAEQRRLTLLRAKAVTAGQLLDNFQRNYERLVAKLDPELAALALTIADVISVEIKKAPLDKVAHELSEQIRKADDSLKRETPGSPAARQAEATAKIAALQARLDGPAKAFQEYQTALAAWQKEHAKIEGNAAEPDTVAHLRAAVAALDQLPAELQRLGGERLAKAAEIYGQIAGLAETYRTVYKPVQDFTQRHKIIHERFRLSFTVAIRPKPDLFDQFFQIVSHGVAGSFCGVEEGSRAFKALVAKHDFSTEAGAMAFANDLLEHITRDHRDAKKPAVVVSKQLKRGHTAEELYDYIFSFDYLTPQYTLSLEDKELSQLSPGERGTLLLIFYLLVDKDDIPFIVDQPEGNLDNQTVYKLLGECIREAKQRRQIIMVTHNPNLAIACDAEQIICASIDARDGHRVTYQSGAIEQPEINQTVLNVLEGTRPAFDNRDAKYFADKGV